MYHCHNQSVSLLKCIIIIKMHHDHHVSFSLSKCTITKMYHYDQNISSISLSLSPHCRPTFPFPHFTFSAITALGHHFPRVFSGTQYHAGRTRSTETPHTAHTPPRGHRARSRTCPVPLGWSWHLIEEICYIKVA